MRPTRPSVPGPSTTAADRCRPRASSTSTTSSSSGSRELRPQLRRFDLFSVLCPDGVFQNDIGGVHDFRPDGIHYSPAASLWLAQHYGPKILDAGLR